MGARGKGGRKAIVVKNNENERKNADYSRRHALKKENAALAVTRTRLSGEIESVDEGARGGGCATSSPILSRLICKRPAAYIRWKSQSFGSDWKISSRNTSRRRTTRREEGAQKWKDEKIWREDVL